MNTVTRKIRLMLTGAVAALGMLLALPAAAGASGESADMTFDMTPRSGTFFKQAYRPADWNVAVTISTADPEILPMKVADLSLPPAGRMRFNPPVNMPVCPDSQVGPPPTNVSVPVATIVARCPKSVIGNGTATFVLNRNNLNPAAALAGYIVVFNGGEVDGRPKLKVYAFSYDTGVGIYTDAVLSREGDLVFNIPQLTSDSAVSNLNLKIPGRNESFFLPNQQITVNLPGGRASGYVLARCNTGSFGYSGSFQLGTRDTDGTPTSPTETVQDAGSAACTGVAGKGRVANIKLKLKNRVLRAGRKAKIGITVRNGGTATLKKAVLRLRTSNRLVRVPKRVVFRNIRPGGVNSKSKKVTVRAKRKARKKKVTIVARSGVQKGKLKIRVK